MCCIYASATGRAPLHPAPSLALSLYMQHTSRNTPHAVQHRGAPLRCAVLWGWMCGALRCVAMRGNARLPPCCCPSSSSRRLPAAGCQLPAAGAGAAVGVATWAQVLGPSATSTSTGLPLLLIRPCVIYVTTAPCQCPLLLIE
jgi:hypothetical protein